jgi:hypothetical protein
MKMVVAANALIVQWLVLPVVEPAGQGSILGLAPYSGGSPLPVTFKKKRWSLQWGMVILFYLGWAMMLMFLAMLIYQL